MKFLQFNLGRGKEAQNLLMQTAKERGADVLLISEQPKWSENSALYQDASRRAGILVCSPDLNIGDFLETDAGFVWVPLWKMQITHSFCARWGAEREDVSQAVGAQLTPDTMVSLMLQSEQIWMLIESFVTLVMKTRELDGRAMCGNNAGQ